MAKLTIELVPQSTWGDNLRSRLPPGKWDQLRKASYAGAGFKCEVCGGVGNKHPVECHEIWEYDDVNHVQYLLGLVSLCPACHECKHYGRAQAVGRGEIALNHLMKVNDWSPKEANIYIAQAFAKWRERSRFSWRLDLSKLKEIEEPKKKYIGEWTL